MKKSLPKKAAYLSAVVLASLPFVSTAALIGTEVSVSVASPNLESYITFEQTTTVSATEVEIESLNDYATNENPNTYVVDISIDINDYYIDLNFDNAGSGSFSTAEFNGYIFTFDSAVAVAFSAANIDFSLTTLGLTASDVSFLDNQLFINVSGLSFNPNSFVRINLDSTGGTPSPVPVPAAFWLFSTGLIGLAGIARKKAA